MGRHDMQTSFALRALLSRPMPEAREFGPSIPAQAGMEPRPSLRPSRIAQRGGRRGKARSASGGCTDYTGQTTPLSFRMPSSGRSCGSGAKSSKNPCV
mgnify:CR=1 FL=1